MNSHEDFGCFNGVVQGDSIKNRHFAQEWSERDEKSTNRKIQNACAKKWDPIMRLHRHGGCESLHTNSRSVEEKILKFRVDSERGKRNIRHLATVSESRVAHNNNLSGQSVWALEYGFLTS